MPQQVPAAPADPRAVVLWAGFEEEIPPELAAAFEDAEGTEPEERLVEFRFDAAGRIIGATLVMQDELRVLLRPDTRLPAEIIRDNEEEIEQIRRKIERLDEVIASTRIAVEPGSCPRAPRAAARPREHRSGRGRLRRGPPGDDEGPEPPDLVAELVDGIRLARRNCLGLASPIQRVQQAVLALETAAEIEAVLIFLIARVDYLRRRAS